MTQTLSSFTTLTTPRLRADAFYQLARLACWSFALVSLCFFVPEVGFDYFVGKTGLVEDAFVVATPVLWIVSLLPFIVVLEAGAAYRSSALRMRGLLMFIVLTLGVAVIVGYGIPAFYLTYVYPSGNSGHQPYVMLGVGLAAWFLLIGASRLMLWKRA